MHREERYPHFDFDFQKIHEHWTTAFGSWDEAGEYLRIVRKRLHYWLEDLGSWIDYAVAVKRISDDLGMSDVEGQLAWLALNRRVRMANEQRSHLSPALQGGEADDVRVVVKKSEDGRHDAVWHEDFRALYMRAMARESKMLRRLRDTGTVPVESQCKERARAHLRWMWSSRLLAYLFERLREKQAICDDDGMWAALDGVFVDRQGRAITRKDLALWASQYHNNKACPDETGKPKKHDLVDGTIEEIQGE